MLSYGLDYPFDDESLALGFNNPNMERDRSFERAYRQMCVFLGEDTARNENDLRLMSESILDDLPELGEWDVSDVSTSSVHDIDAETDSILMGPHDDLSFNESEPDNNIDWETDSILMGSNADLSFNDWEPDNILDWETDSILDEGGNISFNDISHQSGGSRRSMDLLDESDSILEHGNISFSESDHSGPQRHPSRYMAKDEIPIGWESDSILEGSHADVSISELDGGSPQLVRVPRFSGHRGFTVTKMNPLDTSIDEFQSRMLKKPMSPRHSSSHSRKHSPKHSSKHSPKHSPKRRRH